MLAILVWAPLTAVAQPSESCRGVPEGALCDDGNACTVAESCRGGVCTGVRVADGTACTDGNACTVGDVCQAGACTGVRLPPEAPCPMPDAAVPDAGGPDVRAGDASAAGDRPLASDASFNADGRAGDSPPGDAGLTDASADGQASDAQTENRFLAEGGACVCTAAANVRGGREGTMNTNLLPLLLLIAVPLAFSFFGRRRLQPARVRRPKPRR